jgi:photosystem II stability/assembly factor-like uncharacterized protein
MVGNKAIAVGTARSSSGDMIAAIYYSINAGKTWNATTSDLSAMGTKIFSNVAMNADGDALAVANGDNSAQIYFSHDDGKTWTPSGFHQFVPSSPSDYIYSPSFSGYISSVVMNRSQAYMVGKSSDNAAVVYYSDGDGSSWYQQFTPSSPGSTLPNVGDMGDGRFVSVDMYQGRAIAVGSNGNWTGKIYYYDYNNLWRPARLTNSASTDLQTGRFVSVVMRAVYAIAIGYSSTYAAAIYYSSNYGQTWTPTASDLSGMGESSFTSVTMNNNYAIAVGRNYEGSLKIYYSRHYGRTWAPTSTVLGTGNFNSVIMTSTHAIAVGGTSTNSYNTNGSPKIYYSKNSGQTWQSTFSDESVLGSFTTAALVGDKAIACGFFHSIYDMPLEIYYGEAVSAAVGVALDMTVQLGFAVVNAQTAAENALRAIEDAVTAVITIDTGMSEANANANSATSSFYLPHSSFFLLLTILLIFLLR